MEELVDKLGWFITKDPFYSKFQDILFEIISYYQEGKIELNLNKNRSIEDMVSDIYSKRRELLLLRTKAQSDIKPKRKALGIKKTIKK